MSNAAVLVQRSDPDRTKGVNAISAKSRRVLLAKRMLPILLAVSTTVGGLTLLALFGGPLWAGMSYLLIFGLTVATVLTLVALPAIYASFVEYLGVQTVTLDT